MRLPQVEDIQLKKKLTVSQLIQSFNHAGGFSAKKIADGVKILKDMLKDQDCTRFLSFPACIISTGTRGIIKELVKQKLFDVIITTAGTLDHDLARIWKPYYQGSFMADDKELHTKGIHRLGNIFIPIESYGTILEKKIQKILRTLGSKNTKWSTHDLIWEFGKHLDHEKNKESSIVYWAWKNNIPIYVPGITDGAFGSQLWMYYQTHRDLVIDVMADEQHLSDYVFTANKTGALVIGGGISKHHVIWWNQFKGGLDYAVYITTAAEYDGSLSGAQTREAISWGKLKEKAAHITIEGDATIILPFMIAALMDRM